ncbi:hypothetical protein MQM1_053 [Aeromonas phage vB_AsaP_MQM1]|nr:hypothetical protein MQM1_053 [Aeromonas phage vB_AsaP_MQM1]
MKVRLLNDGGFSGLGDVKFPVEVEAALTTKANGDDVYGVPYSELLRIGAKATAFDGTQLRHWLPSWGEAELVE